MPVATDTPAGHVAGGGVSPASRPSGDGTARGPWLGPAPFMAAFAGEHVAATEFVIGVLFVQWGASATDILLGLFLGNALAVASWTLVCARIAVHTRETLYRYLARLGGPGLTVAFNLLSVVLYCVLAGCMITVSASAVRIVFGLAPETRFVPQDPRFVLLVLAIGAVVVAIAARGFARLTSFAMVCAPWMFLMFVVGGVLGVAALQESSPLGGPEMSALDRVAGAVNRAGEGSTDRAFGVWHVAAFAWVCNAPMHLGLGDMAVFRFARRARYGLASAFGAYLGHLVAWVAAALMGVAAGRLLERPLVELDSGEVAYAILGPVGAVAVVLAGWTTANPTLYRAGLALEAAGFGGSRKRATYLVGIVTTCVACFPFVFTGLLDFVGLYGLCLAPVGAMVWAEHDLFSRLALRRSWALRRPKTPSLPALVAWAGGVLFGIGLWQVAGLHLFFVLPPAYAMTAAIYVAWAWHGGGRAIDAGGDPKVVDRAPGQAREEVPPPRERRREPRNPLASRLATGGAAVSLVACVLVALWATQGDAVEMGGVLASVERAKSWLVLPSATYLIFAVLAVWARGRTQDVDGDEMASKDAVSP